MPHHDAAQDVEDKTMGQEEEPFLQALKTVKNNANIVSIQVVSLVKIPVAKLKDTLGKNILLNMLLSQC